MSKTLIERLRAIRRETLTIDKWDTQEGSITTIPASPDYAICWEAAAELSRLQSEREEARRCAVYEKDQKNEMEAEAVAWRNKYTASESLVASLRAQLEEEGKVIDLVQYGYRVLLGSYNDRGDQISALRARVEAVRRALRCAAGEEKWPDAMSFYEPDVNRVRNLYEAKMAGEKVVRELVRLEDDVGKRVHHGKTYKECLDAAAEYRRCEPLAWQAARAFLKEQGHG